MRLGRLDYLEDVPGVRRRPPRREVRHNRRRLVFRYGDRRCDRRDRFAFMMEERADDGFCFC